MTHSRQGGQDLENLILKQTYQQREGASQEYSRGSLHVVEFFKYSMIYCLKGKKKKEFETGKKLKAHRGWTRAGVQERWQGRAGPARTLS